MGRLLHRTVTLAIIGPRPVRVPSSNDWTRGSGVSFKPCHCPSFRAFSRSYSNDRHLRHVTAAGSSVAIPSISARCAASLSRGLHKTIPSSLRACTSRFCLLSLDIGRLLKERLPLSNGARHVGPNLY